MPIEEIRVFVEDNFLLSIGIGILVLLIFFRIWRTMRLYLGNKRFMKKSKKLRAKKYNGPALVDKIKRKRKKNTNSFKKLKGRGKKLVRKYFAYKLDELPVLVRYTHGKLFKRSKKKIQIYAKNERKIIYRSKLKKPMKEFINLSNKFDCLDQFILFLHNLPEAILEDQEYDIYINEQDISIGYLIK